MPTAKDEPQPVRAASLFDPDVLPDLRERAGESTSAVAKAASAARSRPSDALEEAPASLTLAPTRSSIYGDVRPRQRAAHPEGRRSWDYRCGHCAVGNHHRCPQTVPVGAHLNQPATECVCHRHGHHQTIL